MTQTIEQVILKLRRLLPEEFRYDKPHRTFRSDRVSVSICLPVEGVWPLCVRVVEGPVYDTDSLNIAVRRALEHFNRPEMAEECVKRKVAREEKHSDVHSEVLEVLRKAGLPANIMTALGRRGLRVEVLNHTIKLHASLKSPEDLAKVLEVLPRW